MKQRRPAPSWRNSAAAGSLIDVINSGEHRARTHRVARAAGLLLVALIVGTVGYSSLSGDQHGLLDCLYMTMITVSTVGFGESIPIDSDALKGFTMALIIGGGGSLMYFLTALASYIIEGDLAHGLGRLRNERRVAHQQGHIVVAGAGSTGTRAVQELRSNGRAVVVIDVLPEPIKQVVEGLDREVMFLIGDACSEHTLSVALDGADGLIAALPDDRDNLLLCVTARQLQPRLHIVARIADESSRQDLADIGVLSAVDIASHGADQLVAELVMPQTAHDSSKTRATSDTTHYLVVTIDEGAAGSTMATVAELAKSLACGIVGVHEPESGDFVPARGEDRVQGGTRILLGGPLESIARIEERAVERVGELNLIRGQETRP